MVLNVGIEDLWYKKYVTLQVTNISEMALRPIFAATMTSSCLQEVPAATAFAVARVIGRVDRNNSSGPEIINLVLLLIFFSF